MTHLLFTAGGLAMAGSAYGEIREEKLKLDQLRHHSSILRFMRS